MSFVKYAESYLQGTPEHPICQDYVTINKGLTGVFLSAVLSDGCSSSPDTDFGARIVAKTIEHHPLSRPAMGFFTAPVALLGLDYQCLDATALWAVPNHDLNTLDIFMRGDGVVIVGNGDEVTIMVRTFKENAPFYFSYDFFPERLAAYQAFEHINTPTTTFYVFSKATGLLIRTVEALTFGENELFTSNPVMRGVEPIIRVDKADYVLLLSDGILALADPSGLYHTIGLIPEAIYRVVSQVTAIRNFSDGFLNRRLTRFIQNVTSDRRVRGELPVQFKDDLSVIYLGEIDASIPTE